MVPSHPFLATGRGWLCAECGVRNSGIGSSPAAVPRPTLPCSLTWGFAQRTVLWAGMTFLCLLIWVLPLSINKGSSHVLIFFLLTAVFSDTPQWDALLPLYS